MISYQAATELWHLEAILSLQQANLPKNISKEEAEEQGFVTVEHDLAILSEMNQAYGHQIALEGDQIAGYALMMMPSFRDRIPVLIPMFELLDGLAWQGTKLASLSYYVIGQVCVAKPYRGKGVSTRLYDTMTERLVSDFKLMVTEVSSKNVPSLLAHKKAGFEELLSYKDKNGKDWVIVVRELIRLYSKIVL